MMVDWLSGNLGGRTEQALAARVARVVVAGGLLGSLGPQANAASYSRQANSALQPIK